MLRQNIKNRAVSQITGQCTSLANHAGNTFALTDDGLCRIVGYRDSGKEIKSWVKSNKFDLGENRLKRINYFYFGIEGNGDVRLSIFADDKQVAQYTVPVLAHRGRQEIRVQIGKGVAARYWAWKLENLNGAFFVLHSVKILPGTLITGQRGN